MQLATIAAAAALAGLSVEPLRTEGGDSSPDSQRPGGRGLLRVGLEPSFFPGITIKSMCLPDKVQ